ncbi:amidohydrolase [Corallococcus sp. H22C18031201]|uniref:amidohydrolase family protein n=1 Tax=Citreicoccus inhibens TaxID=2849499 RepID=UPI000E765FA8|nr:amidohydrolase family protein [Citreicoccus inhibens]MBU8896447.1 amidohydrolase [Citreicoccus inhibens]RJS24179.1 amidohydrolase [Corallococcus sp. H22C18031201]
MKIDIHTHILPAELPRFAERYGYGGFITLEHHQPCRARMLRDDGKFFREIESNCWDPVKRIEECDAIGVHVQALSTIPVMFSYWTKPEHGEDLARFLNDHLASVVRAHPKRFVGLGTVPLQSPERAVRELERCVRELGFVGVQIGSHVNDMNLSDPALFPFFQAASELGASIFVHPWDMMGEAKMQKYWLPWLVGMPAEVSLAICSLIFGGVMERLPKLRLAFAHGGGSFPGTLGRIQHGFEARPDLVAVDNPVPPREYLGRFWVDSLVHDADTLRGIVKLFGPDKVALGSDYPFPLGEERPGTLIESLTELSPAAREGLLWKNALAWLGRSREDFAP